MWVSLNNKVQLRQHANLPSPTETARTEARWGQLEPFFFFNIVLLNLRGHYYAFPLLPPAPAKY